MFSVSDLWNHQLSIPYFKGKSISLPTENFIELTPYCFFSVFWPSDIIKYLAIQTNSFCTQVSGKYINKRKRNGTVYGYPIAHGDSKNDISLNRTPLLTSVK